MSQAARATDPQAKGETALSLTGASMSFAGVRVLHGADFYLRRGEIRALVGKNGSGKSTLIKILSGFNRPEPGAELTIGASRIPLPADPEAVRRAGLAFVHQDLGLIAEASIIDNMLVGRFAATHLRPIRWRAERRRVRDALARFGVGADPAAPVSRLSAVERALVAIARGFLDVGEDGGVIVLDEPTAFLPEHDVHRLFAAIRRLAAAGTAVVYVSHRLDEVLSLTETVTVLRDGHVMHEGRTADLDEEALVRHILGEEIRRFYPRLAQPAEEVALTVTGLTGAVACNFSTQVRRGEIVGLTGLAGAGYEEIPYLIVGAQTPSGGVVADGVTALEARAVSPAAARELGIVLLPADRQRQSGGQQASLRDNVTLPVLERFAAFGATSGPLSALRGLAPLALRAEWQAAAALLRRFNVQPPDPDRALRTYSGGNQQKALIAKWIQTAPKVLLLHEPAQGIDVGSKQDIFRCIEAFSESGVSIVIASAEVEDLARLCHRVIVFRRGAVAGELSGAALSEQAIQNLAFRETSPSFRTQETVAHVG